MGCRDAVCIMHRRRENNEQKEQAPLPQVQSSCRTTLKKNDSWYLINRESKKMIFGTPTQSSSRGAKKLAMALNWISMSWT